MAILSPARLLTHTLRARPWGQPVARILSAALEAVEPGQAVARHLQRQGDELCVDDRSYNLRSYRRILLVGVGKAALPMGQAVARILAERLTGGVLITKEGHAATRGDPLPPSVEVFEAGHPIPDERGLQATRRLAQRLSDAGEGDLILCVLSGGGSALLAAPAEGVHLGDIQALTTALLRCGANIQEINTLRKHLDTVKGGGLARLAAPAEMITFILSDVIGDPLDVIASGPTVADASTFKQACAILERYQLAAGAPPAVLRRLQQGARGQIAETPKPDQALFSGVHNLLVASNRHAAAAALHQAHSEGLNSLLLTTSLQGEASQAGRFAAALARQMASCDGPLARPACLLLGGETTVTLRGRGRGGRNQELALGAVADLAGLSEVAVVALATDGGDGPTDAAGAVAGGETWERARALGLDPHAALANNDAYPFFQALDDLLRTGPTQTNVNDLTFVFAF